MTTARIALTAAALLLVLAAPEAAAAEDRTTSGRARMELGFDHGYGFGTEDQYVEIAADLRLWAPSGIGAVLRTGAATRLVANALAIEVGIGYRLDLVATPHAGLQLAGVIGPSIAAGPFDRGQVTAYGGFAMVHLDFWYRNFFVGVGVSAHALMTETAGQGGRQDPILTLAPTVRIGGDWGL